MRWQWNTDVFDFCAIVTVIANHIAGWLHSRCETSLSQFIWFLFPLSTPLIAVLHFNELPLWTVLLLSLGAGVLVAVIVALFVGPYLRKKIIAGKGVGAETKMMSFLLTEIFLKDFPAYYHSHLARTMVKMVVKHEPTTQFESLP